MRLRVSARAIRRDRSIDRRFFFFIFLPVHFLAYDFSCRARVVFSREARPRRRTNEGVTRARAPGVACRRGSRVVATSRRVGDDVAMLRVHGVHGGEERGTFPAHRRAREIRDAPRPLERVPRVRPRGRRCAPSGSRDSRDETRRDTRDRAEVSRRVVPTSYRPPFPPSLVRRRS